MKIRTKSKEKQIVFFKDLKPGDFFVWPGVFLRDIASGDSPLNMKIKGNSFGSNSISMDVGTLYTTEEDQQVLQVIVEATIEFTN